MKQLQMNVHTTVAMPAGWGNSSARESAFIASPGLEPDVRSGAMLGYMAVDKGKWRVGEVAAATGLTVRALHHYDRIGLVMPSPAPG
jgi:MerR family regulatory protein